MLTRLIPGGPPIIGGGGGAKLTKLIPGGPPILDCGGEIVETEAGEIGTSSLSPAIFSSSKVGEKLLVGTTDAFRDGCCDCRLGGIGGGEWGAPFFAESGTGGGGPEWLTPGGNKSKGSTAIDSLREIGNGKLIPAGIGGGGDLGEVGTFISDKKSIDKCPPS